MWWNFVGRRHDEIAGYRQSWQDADERFGAVRGYRGRSSDCLPRRCPPSGCGPADTRDGLFAEARWATLGEDVRGLDSAR